MTKETKDLILVWTSIIVAVFTVVMTVEVAVQIYIALAPTHPVQPVPVASQIQAAQNGTWAQTIEQIWPWLHGNYSAIIAGGMLLFATYLNIKLVRYRVSMKSADRLTDRSIQEHPKAELMEHVERSLKPSKPPPNEDIAVGTKVRLRSPRSEADRCQSPGWIDAMDACIGQEFVVQSCESNGLLRLEGLRPKVCVAWVEPLPQVAPVRAK
jgi:hypothetical protein